MDGLGKVKLRIKVLWLCKCTSRYMYDNCQKVTKRRKCHCVTLKGRIGIQDNFLYAWFIFGLSLMGTWVIIQGGASYIAAFQVKVPQIQEPEEKNKHQCWFFFSSSVAISELSIMRCSSQILNIWSKSCQPSKPDQQESLLAHQLPEHPKITCLLKPALDFLYQRQHESQPEQMTHDCSALCTGHLLISVLWWGCVCGDM